ncbi:hypothetical protein [Aquimarina sp. AU119]|uniref:hypothetical protein n=1 Tax=Aquimarina sp. AU119 TaxID=2108528 RepID=UPI000D69FBD3|nr:hypothetical protein [Aquimarina sp. AU119]
MTERIYQINDGNIKTIFFGKNELIFSEEKIELSVKFTELHKYPRLIEKTVKVRFDEIKNIIFNDGEFKINAYVKIDALRFKKSFKLSDSDLTSLKDQIEELSHKKSMIKQSKFQLLLNHHGIITVFTGALFAYLISTGGDFSDVQGKRKFYGYIIQKIIETLGVTISIIISILISVYGVYSIWKKVNEPYDEKTNKLMYSDIRVK